MTQRNLKTRERDALADGPVVLLNGDQTVPFGEGLYAVPLSLLWREA